MKDLSTKKAAIVGILKRIERKDRVITPHAVVKEARSTASPLHNYFTWDNHKAAEQYRLFQARVLINQVKVEIMGQKREAFMHARVRVGNVETPGYFSTEKVLTDRDLHEQVVEQALQELEYWQKKYNDLSELVGVIDTRKIKRLKNGKAKK